MDEINPTTVLCLASYEKGGEFIRACKRRGCHALLLTVTALEGAAWPRESLDDIFYMPDLSDVDAVRRGVDYLARSRAIDRIGALDDYDVETAAALRERLCLPGMGATAARAVRDKLTMRVRARDAGLLVPDFAPVANDAALEGYLARVPPPWVLKPRAEVSTIGIARIEDPREVWTRLDAAGDRRASHLIERYIPGTVYHVDSLVDEGEVLFAETHEYGRPPLNVYHDGGVFLTRTLPRESDDARALRALNGRALRALAFERGATHLEFIKGDDDGQLYFLEAGARVGGAYIADMVEAASSLNLWAEWAAIELATPDQPYRLPAHRRDYAGAIVSLARQERPDTSAYRDEEIVLRLDKRHHAGLILASDDPARIAALLDEYARRFATDFAATLPPYTGRPPTGSSGSGGGESVGA